MARTGNAPQWIVQEQVEASVRLEPVLVLLCLALASWLIYKAFLRDVSPERHKNLRTLFRNLLGHGLFGLFFFGAYELVTELTAVEPVAGRLLPYLGFLSIVWGCVVFIKTMRIMAFEYLFLGSMRLGVPLLLVNIFSLALSLVLSGWVLTTYFEVKVAPLLATSAVFSIVLGLALQDTLGNLFAGIALQLDKPFELGDWIELKNGSDKVAGQVLEITWRATILLAITDEIITIPNRNMAQWQISNFAARTRPFVRSQVFRIPFDASLDDAKEALLAAASTVSGIFHEPAPVVIVNETTDSWVSLKLVYSIADYGAQYGIADRLLGAGLQTLEKAGIHTASNRLLVDGPRPVGRA